MKHEEMKERTKISLINTFRALLLKKPMNRITVRELVEECGVNRKTFYNHFEDIYDMLRKMLEQDTAAIFGRGDLITDYDLIIDLVLDYIEQNEAILKNILSCTGRAELHAFLNADVGNQIYTLVYEVEQKLGLSVGTEYKQFLADFFTHSVSGIVLDWMENRASHSREQIKQYITTVLKASIPAALTTGLLT